MNSNIILLFVLVSVALSDARQWSRCELAQAMKRSGFGNLLDWVCLAEQECQRRTEARGGPNSDGSFDYGIFQINDRYWCSTGLSPGKDCNIRCDSLRNDHLNDDFQCIRKIFGVHGFEGWYAWAARCKRELREYIAGCGV